VDEQPSAKTASRTNMHKSPANRLGLRLLDAPNEKVSSNEFNITPQ